MLFPDLEQPSNSQNLVQMLRVQYNLLLERLKYYLHLYHKMSKRQIRYYPNLYHRHRRVELLFYPKSVVRAFLRFF